MEAEGVAPSSPRCERGILLLNYAPEWGDRRGSNPHLRVHSVSCSATTPRPPGFVPGGRFERPLLESESSGLPVSRPGSRGGGNRTLVGRSSGGCSAIELHLYRRCSWNCPSDLRFPKPALIYPSSTPSRGTNPSLVTISNRPAWRAKGAEMELCPGAPVWNRTSISCASGRRHHQIGYESIIVAGVVPGHGHRRLFGCQRSRPAVAGFVRG